MATISAAARSVRQEAQLEGAPVSATLDWGNSAPLALLALAVTTFILSMINATAVSVGMTPVVFGVALMFGGLAQLIVGIIQLRTGNTFSGVLFAGFGAFWLSFFVLGQWFLKGRAADPVGARGRPVCIRPRPGSGRVRAFYLALEELCEFSYGRPVLPVWSPTKPLTGATLNASQPM